MNREIYWKEVELIKLKKKQLDERMNELKSSYIDECKPCNVGDIAEITLSSGRKTSGEVKSFGILSDGNVHVTSYKEGNNTKYITKPNLGVVVVN